MGAKKKSVVNTGDLVWAHLKGFRPWPAIIIAHPEGITKKTTKYVMFFGSKDFAWVANKNLSSYEQNLEKNSKVKGEKIWAAINAAQGYDTKISKIRISYDGRESMKLSYLCEFSDYYEKKRKLGVCAREKLVMPIEEEKKRKKRRRYNTRQSVAYR